MSPLACRSKCVLLAAIVLCTQTAAQVSVSGARFTSDSGQLGKEFGISAALHNGIFVAGAPRDDQIFIQGGAAYIFASDGTQLFKLQANDMLSVHHFGSTVAIHNGLVAVGAPFSDTINFNAGIAYIFDASTGAQLEILIPNDSMPSDHFGDAIAIHDGIVIVGSDLHDVHGLSSGAAYTFDASTGTQLAMLAPADGIALDRFGSTVSIHSGTAVIGAKLSGPNGTLSGSAYLFDANTGLEIAKLLPPSVGEDDLFGFSVAIDANIAVVTGLGQGSSQSNRGFAYVFDAHTGEQLLELIPSESILGRGFGISSAINDGVIAIGANRGTNNGLDSGSVYLFDAKTGLQINKLFVPDAMSGDSIGRSLSIDNGFIATGAVGDDDNGFNFGAAYTIDMATPSQVTKFLPADGSFQDHFATDVSISNGRVAIGAADSDENGISAGAAYVFSVSSFIPIVKLLANDAEPGDHFGVSVSIDGDTVAVGAPNDDDNGESSGAAYLFDSTLGSQLFKLLPADGASNDLFGISISLSNQLVAVGSPGDADNGLVSGSVYLFDRDTGLQTAKLLPDDGTAFDFFGHTVATDAQTIAVGALMTHSHIGKAYLFDAITGEQFATLHPDSPTMSSQFGSSIDIENGIVAIGAPGDQTNGVEAGAVYLFDAATGTQILKLFPDKGAPSDHFGTSVDLGTFKGTPIVAVGATNFTDTISTGPNKAYVFDIATGEQLWMLLPYEPAQADAFGGSIATESGFIVVGASRDDANAIGSGSAYRFNINTPPCFPDLNDDGILNFFDISAFLNAYLAQDPIADFTGDGFFNFIDISAFLSSFNAGCP